MSTSHLSVVVVVVVVDHCAFRWALMCMSFGLNCSLYPLFPMRRFMWNCLCFISITSTYRNMLSLCHTAPVLSPGFACFYVHASVRHHEPIYIFLMNIYWWHLLPFLFFYFFWIILGICVLDPAVSHCSSCTNWMKLLRYNKCRVNQRKAVGGRNPSKVICQVR